MYQVYCSGSKIYEHGVDELTLIAPVLDLELGKTGSFEFTIYPDHPNYAAVEPMAKVTVDRSYKTIYTGRVLSIRYGFYNEKQVTCEGELALLLDVLIEPHSYTGSFVGYLSYIINLYNAKVDSDQRFAVGSATVAEFYPFTSEEKEYRSAFDILQDKMVSRTGGYLQVRNEGGVRYLDLLSYYADGNASTQTMLMRLMAGLLRPTSGHVWIDGKKLGKDILRLLKKTRPWAVQHRKLLLIIGGVFLCLSVACNLAIILSV